MQIYRWIWITSSLKRRSEVSYIESSSDRSLIKHYPCDKSQVNHKFNIHHTYEIKTSMVILMVLANFFLLFHHISFFCQLCVRLSGGTVVTTGSEVMTYLRKGRSFGHPTTVHLDLETGTPVNQTTNTKIKIVCQFVKTSVGKTLSAMRFCHTFVKPLNCKQ